MRSRFLALAVACFAVFFTMPVAAAPTLDRLVVSQSGGLTAEVEQAVRVLAQRWGVQAITRHTGTLRMVEVARADGIVQVAPPDHVIPMASLAVDPVAAARVVGYDVAEALIFGEVAMGETSAALRGAQVGDMITFIGWDGAEHTHRVGAIAPDAAVWSAELVFAASVAAGFGFERPSSIVLDRVPATDPVVFDLYRSVPGEFIRVDAASDGFDPDAVQSVAHIKQEFGEFAYKDLPGDRIRIDPAWVEANIVVADIPHLGRFRCHRDLVPRIEAAIAEVRAQGLISEIDRADFQNGGCWVARAIRGGDKGGALSRHSWGAAIDFNPSTNPYGGQVSFDRRVAEIFRDHGFAWGGGWTYPDGGHFEWRG